jgi:hypothetical protein
MMAAQWFSNFLLKAFVRRVNRRVPMRTLRFCRSTRDVRIRAAAKLASARPKCSMAADQMQAPAAGAHPDNPVDFPERR